MRIAQSSASTTTTDNTVIRCADVCLASAGLVLCLPAMLVSCLRSALLGKALASRQLYIDNQGQHFALWELNAAPLKKAGWLVQVIQGELSLVGSHVSAKQMLNHSELALKPGVFSEYGLHQKTGLVHELKEPSAPLTLKRYAALLCKNLLASMLYRNQHLSTPSQFHLFGLRIDNCLMTEAIDWLCAPAERGCRSAVFVNVNSINSSHSDSGLSAAINHADYVFADGSGVRLGARRLGVALRDNVNGTDLLPPLCERAQAQQLRLFFLGGGPGIAAAAAKRLQKDYPQLAIAGCQDGYFDKTPAGNQQIVEAINASGADLVLVGFGSPVQERWLQDHRHRLNARSVLAVGGLFDFFSGSVSRAPLWMRELGMEWLWRLAQQPGDKWQRYLLGNPLYLFRLIFVGKENHHD